MSRTSYACLITLFAVGLSTPILAAPEHLQTIEEQCAVQLNGSPAFCTCLSDTAADTLNDNQQAFTAAQVTGNMAEVARVQQLLNADEAMGAMTFMTTFGGCSR